MTYNNSNIEIPSKKRKKLGECSTNQYLIDSAGDSLQLSKLYEPYLIDTLKSTSNKVSLNATQGFSSVNKDSWSQVEDVLREYPKLRERVGVRRGNESNNNQFEAEVFDDGDFYQTLLREVIESKTGQYDEDENDGDMDVFKNKKKKVKKDVDTRATKGRKIKYNVHEKLQNFMVPIPPSKDSWNESQMDELFSSLLGGDVDNNKEDKSVNIGNLKLF